MKKGERILAGYCRWKTLGEYSPRYSYFNVLSERLLREIEEQQKNDDNLIDFLGTIYPLIGGTRGDRG